MWALNGFRFETGIRWCLDSAVAPFVEDISNAYSKGVALLRQHSLSTGHNHTLVLRASLATSMGLPPHEGVGCHDSLFQLSTHVPKHRANGRDHISFPVWENGRFMYFWNTGSWWPEKTLVSCILKRELVREETCFGFQDFFKRLDVWLCWNSWSLLDSLIIVVSPIDVVNFGICEILKRSASLDLLCC